MSHLESKYIVAVSRNYAGPESCTEWLTCITYDPYRRGGIVPILTTPDADEAFVFRTLAAAEMAAVWCGGIVTDACGAGKDATP